MRFKKGQSGNPGGRPKEEAEVKALAREHTQEAIEKLVHWMRSDNAKASVSAAQALLDRGYGKPAQALDVSGAISYGRIAIPTTERHPLDTAAGTAAPRNLSS